MRHVPLRSDLDWWRCAVTLEGVQIGLVLRWAYGPGCWYADVEAADGTVIAACQRVTPGSPLLPDRTAPGLPPGLLIVGSGPDPYRRGDLGTRVRLYYVTAAELASLGVA